MFLLNVFSPQKWINNKNNQYIDGYVNLNVNLLDDFYIIPDEKNNGNGIVSTYCGYIYDVEENISLEHVRVKRIVSYQREWERIYSGMSARFECFCSKTIEYNNLFKKYNYEPFLIKDDVFLDVMKQNCFFTFGERSEIDLKQIINCIKIKDANASVYFFSGGLEKYNDDLRLISNELWISSNISCEEIQSLIDDTNSNSNYDIRVLNKKDINTNIEYVIIGKGIIDSYDNYNEKILKNDITVLKFD